MGKFSEFIHGDKKQQASSDANQQYPSDAPPSYDQIEPSQGQSQHEAPNYNNQQQQEAPDYSNYNNQQQEYGPNGYPIDKKQPQEELGPNGYPIDKKHPPDQQDYQYPPQPQQQQGYPQGYQQQQGYQQGYQQDYQQGYQQGYDPMNDPNVYKVPPQMVNITQANPQHLNPQYQEYLARDQERVKHGDYPKPHDYYGKQGPPLNEGRTDPKSKTGGKSFPGKSGVSYHGAANQ